MPYRAKRPCTYPGCGVLVSKGRCAQHRTQAAREDNQRRGTAAQRGYAGKRWAALRKEALIRDRFKCQDCGAPVTGKGEAHVDHIVPKARGGRDELGNLQTLCRTCHSRKTARQDGGFGRVSS